MPGVVIVGGGVIGSATAYFLARAGADVTLLERGELASEASGAAAGLLAALSDEGGDRGPDFQSLCLDSLALYKSLLPELEATGIDLRYRRSGVLHVAMDEAEVLQLRHRFDHQAAIAPSNRWLEARDAAKLETQLSSEVRAGMLSPDEHYVDPQRLTLAFAEAARKHGARLLTNTTARAFQRRGDRVLGVRSSDGSFDAGSVILAGGPWTATMASRLGSRVPVRPVRGQMVSLEGPTPPLRHVIWARNAYLVSREDGQTFVGATVEERGFRRRTTATAVRGLHRAAADIVPGLASAKVLRAWAGLRPATPDGLPIIGLLPGWRNVWVSTGHFRNGILLAPLSGRLVAESVLAGQPAERLTPFSPLRFG